MALPNQPDPADPFLVSVVDRALEPYRGKLSPEALEAMRVQLEDVLLSHPLGMTLAQRVRPRKPRVASEETERDDALGATPPAVEATRKTGDQGK